MAEFFYIVQLHDGVFLADWGGDPGRTCDRATAHRFDSYDTAQAGLMKAVRLHAYPQGRLRAVPISETWSLIVVLQDGGLIKIPAIGNNQARNIVKAHQIPSVAKINVERNGQLIAEWINGQGWLKFQEIRSPAELAQ